MIIVAAVIIAEEGRDLPDVRMARITPRLRASTNNGGCSSGLLLADDDDDDDNDGGAEVVADGGDDDDDDDGRAMIMYFFGLGGFDLRGESLVHVPAISGRSSLSVAARCGVKTVARTPTSLVFFVVPLRGGMVLIPKWMSKGCYSIFVALRRTQFRSGRRWRGAEISFFPQLWSWRGT